MEYYESLRRHECGDEFLKLDLYRRDLRSIPAITLNKREYGTLIDYFGAQKDMREKVIRVLHNLSFVEDPTRY